MISPVHAGLLPQTLVVYPSDLISRISQVQFRSLPSNYLRYHVEEESIYLR